MLGEGGLPRLGRSPTPGPPSPPARSASPSSPSKSRAGSRRNRKAIDHQLACVPADGGLVSGRVPQTYWLYGSFEFKMSVPVEQAMQSCFRKVDQLCDKLVRHDLVPVESLGMLLTARMPKQTWAALRSELHYDVPKRRILLGAVPPQRADGGHLQRGMRLHRINGRPVATQEMVAAAVPDSQGGDVEVQAGFEARGDIVFDLIATRKQIDKHLCEQTARHSPHRLGAEIYRYVAEHHDGRVATTFVGLTDNTARRVGRDVYCHSEHLSPKKYDFDAIDNRRMFIIDPPDDVHQQPR